MAEPVDDPYIGKTLDRRYHVLRLLGRGGMGAVYEADHIGLGKRVAIKFLLDRSPDLVARFQREARAASKLEHEHVVQIFDVGTDPSGVDFMVMEYVEGRDLRRVLQDGRLPLSRALHIARQLLDGLQAIHDSGIVHRDIKPANILLTEQDGDADFVKIMDFGISKVLGADQPAITKTGHVVGTPQYMAPEQLKGQPADPRSDLYAAGLTIYEMLAGAPPFVGSDTTQVAAMHLTMQAQPIDEVVSDLPEAIVRAIDRALDKSPEMRFGSALAMAQALAVEGSERTAVTVQTRPSRPPPATKTDSQPPTKVDKPVAAVREQPAAAAMREPTTSPARTRSHVALYAFAALIVVAVPITVFVAMRGDDRAAPLRPSTPPTPPAPPPTDAGTRSKAEAYLAAAREADAAGQAELAVASYRAYLDTVPSAPDADDVTARIVALTRPPQPADAGIAGAPPRHAPPQYCRCVSAHDELLCSKPQELLCRCQLGMKPLCIEEPAVGRACNADFYKKAIPGQPCWGYLANKSTSMRGTYACTNCGHPGRVRGHPGASCQGFARGGEPVEGTLRDCVSKRPE